MRQERNRAGEEAYIRSEVDRINEYAVRLGVPLRATLSSTFAPVNAGELYAALRKMHWNDRKLTVIDAKNLPLGIRTYSGELLDAAIARVTSEGSA